MLLLSRSKLSYNGYVFPDAAQAMAWVIEFLPMAVIVLYPIYTIYVYKEKKARIWIE